MKCNVVVIRLTACEIHNLSQSAVWNDMYSKDTCLQRILMSSPRTNPRDWSHTSDRWRAPKVLSISVSVLRRRTCIQATAFLANTTAPRCHCSSIQSRPDNDRSTEFLSWTNQEGNHDDYHGRPNIHVNEQLVALSASKITSLQFGRFVLNFKWM